MPRAGKLSIISLYLPVTFVAGPVAVTGQQSTSCSSRPAEALQVQHSGALLQVQFSLLDRRPLNGMLQLCEKHDIHLLTYGSIGGGLLSDQFAAQQPSKDLLGEVQHAAVRRRQPAIIRAYTPFTRDVSIAWQPSKTADAALSVVLAVPQLQQPGSAGAPSPVA